MIGVVRLAVERVQVFDQSNIMIMSLAWCSEDWGKYGQFQMERYFASEHRLLT
jgi:hypothetical protein